MKYDKKSSMVLKRFFLSGLVSASVVSLSPLFEQSTFASTWDGGTGVWSSDGSPGWNGTGVPNAIGAVAQFNTIAAETTTTQDIAGGQTVGSILFGGSTDARWIINPGTNGLILNQDGAGAGKVLISNTNSGVGALGSLLLGTGTLSIADDVLMVNSSGSTNTGTVQINSTVTGAGSFTWRNESSSAIAAAGAMRMGAGANTFVGNTLIQKGTVTFTGASSFGNANNIITVGAAGEGNAALLSAANITEAHRLVVGANSGGTITIGGLGTGNMTYSGTVGLNDNLVISSATTGTNSITFSGIISGNYGLTKEGAGIAVISGANSFTGDIVINAGHLRAGSGTSVPHGAGFGDVIVNAGARFSTTSSEAINGLWGSGTVSNGSGSSRQLTVGLDGESSTFSGLIENGSGFGALILEKSRGGTFTLNGSVPNTYTGTTSVGAGSGTLLLDFANLPSKTNLVSSSSPLQVRGGTIKILGSSTGTTSQTFSTTSAFNIGGGEGRVVVDGNGGDLTTLTLSSTFTRAVLGSVDFSTVGNAQIASGVGTTNGIIGGYATFGGVSFATNNGGFIAPLADGNYLLTSTAGNTSALYGSTIDNVDVDSSPVLDGSITVNSLRFSEAAANTLTLTGTNTVSSGGVLVSSNVGSNTSTIAGGTIQGTSGVDLIIHQHNTSGILDISSQIVDNTSATALTKVGEGTLRLSNTSNSYTGATFVGRGILELGAAGVIPDAGSVTIYAATLDLNGFDETFATVTSIEPAVITNSSATPATLTVTNQGAYIGTIQDGVGKVSLNVTGGVASLSGTNTFSGTTAVTGGSLTLNNANALQNSTLTTGNVVFSSGVTSNSFTVGGLSGSGSITLANNAGSPAPINLNVGKNNSNTTFSGVLSGPGSLTKVGTGTTTLDGANSYTGNTTVSGGTLDVATTGSIDTSAAVNVAAGGTLITDRVRNTALTVDGVTNIRANGGTAGASKVETLTIGGSGKLNLTDNDLVVGTAANVDAVRTAIIAGKANNAASGITSDAAAFGTTTGFGYAMGNDTAISPLLAGSLSGQSYDADSVLVKYTFLGDADLDGDSDLNDLGLWAQSFTGDLGNPVNPATYWTSGDFDYDGDTDLNDLGFWAGTFTGDLGGGAGSLIVVAPGAPASAVAALNSMGITVVPEPSTFVLAGVGLAGLAIAARRKRFA